MKQRSLTNEDIDIVLEMIEERKLKKKIDINIDKNDVAKNRSIRVYTRQYSEFAKWCTKNNVTQANALYTAINLLMKR